MEDEVVDHLDRKGLLLHEDIGGHHDEEHRSDVLQGFYHNVLTGTR